MRKKAQWIIYGCLVIFLCGNVGVSLASSIYKGVHLTPTELNRVELLINDAKDIKNKVADGKTEKAGVVKNFLVLSSLAGSSTLPAVWGPPLLESYELSIDSDSFPVLQKKSVRVNAVPEPTSIFLFGAGIVGLIGAGARRRRS